MNKSSDSPDDTSPQPVEEVRTEEPKAPFGADEPNPSVVSDETVEEKGPQGDDEPATSGYGERDPKTEMPQVSSAPDSGDTREHGGTPDDKERGLHE